MMMIASEHIMYMNVVSIKEEAKDNDGIACIYNIIRLRINIMYSYRDLAL